jgi:hypothetical protein
MLFDASPDPLRLCAVQLMANTNVKQSCPTLTDAGGPFRNKKIRFKHKRAEDRYLGFCISPQVREN